MGVFDGPRTGAIASSAMVSGGLTAKLAEMSSTISSIALLTGILLSLTMIVVRIWKFHIYRKSMRLEREERHLRIALLRAEE